MEHFIRPKATVLPDSATIPDANLIRPAPDRFSHRVRAPQPYYYASPRNDDAPDGTFDTGAEVVVLSHAGGRWCHVADARGLHVVTAFDGLQALP